MTIRPAAAPSALPIPAAVLTFTLSLALSLAAAAPAGAAEMGTADERAAAVAARAMEALGGEQAWADTRYLSFGFVGRRWHWWDRETGRHRVEGTDQEGNRWVVIHDLDSREGRAWAGGVEATGEQAAEMLENAYGAWVNDTYWLLAPYKLRDPGVTLAYDREESLDGKTYDVLALSFAGVGLTPGDRYWVWIDRGSGLMDRWAYVLQNQPADSEPTAWKWEGWERHGGIMLAPRRLQVGSDRVLDLAPIAVPDALPEAAFTSPEPMAPASEDESAAGGSGR
jgi:hypothetical protein